MLLPSVGCNRRHGVAHTGGSTDQPGDVSAGDVAVKASDATVVRDFVEAFKSGDGTPLFIVRLHRSPSLLTQVGG